MRYENVIFDKQNKLINGRNPFYTDESGLVDYDLDSEEEWHELHCEDLENESLLKDDETEPNGDDTDLVAEGFIVADDHYSNAGSDIEYDDDENGERSRHDLVRNILDRQNKVAQSIMKPYIKQDIEDLSEFRAVAFKKKNNLISN